MTKTERFDIEELCLVLLANHEEEEMVCDCESEKLKKEEEDTILRENDVPEERERRLK